MLEIYKSIEKKIANDKVTHDIVRIKKIEDDCWINLHAPTEEEIDQVAEQEAREREEKAAAEKETNEVTE